MNRFILSFIALSALSSTTAAMAGDVTVNAQVTSFSPEIVFVNPGDTVSFRRMSSHLVKSLDGMSPSGAAPLSSAISADYDYNVAMEGIYVYRCTIHWAARMGGVIVAGKPANAKQIVDRYLATAGNDAAAKLLLDKLASELPKHGM